MKTYIPLLAILLYVGSNQLYSQTVEELIASAEIINESNYSDALAIYEKILEMDPNNFEAIWNAAFLNSKLGYAAHDADDKKFYLERAVELAEKSYKIDPNHYRSNYVMAVSLGRIGDIRSAKDRVKNATLIKEYADKALELNPKHAATWHMVGKWHYRLSTMNVAEKAAAALFYGGLPGGASLEKAELYFKNAIEHRPEYILYHLDLAFTLVKMGKKQEAIETLEKTVSMNPFTQDDLGYLEKAQKLLKRLT